MAQPYRCFVLVGVAFALVTALAFAACGGEEEAGTASPAATAARTATPMATGTPQPTATRAPTKTPQATATAVPPTPTASPPTATLTATPASSARIAFISDRDGNWEIYVMNADGTGQTNLSNDPGKDFTPAWSP